MAVAEEGQRGGMTRSGLGTVHRSELLGHGYPYGGRREVFHGANGFFRPSCTSGIADNGDPMAEELARALGDARGVLFLCTGNMVRSAFADLYAHHLCCPLPVRSAATVYRNDGILAETARALVERGVPVAWTRAFRPSHLDDVLPQLDPKTLVLGMARMHLEPLARRPELRERAFLLAELSGRGEEIPDPVLDGADFTLTFELVARGVQRLVERLR
jgi:protein-tyrosine-phosphatase